MARLTDMQILRRDPLHRGPGCWYIQGSRMLRDLDERTLEGMARMSTMATFGAGEFLHEAGRPMEAVTFINKGRIKVYRLARGEAADHRPAWARRCLRRDRDGRPRRAGRDAFLQLASRDPDLALRLAEAMGEKLQDARERIADFAFRDIRGRVAHLIVAFLERERLLRGEATLERIAPGLTHRDMADIVGTRRESVTLALNSLEREGVIRLADGQLVVLEEDNLRTIADV